MSPCNQTNRNAASLKRCGNALTACTVQTCRAARLRGRHCCHACSCWAAATFRVTYLKVITRKGFVCKRYCAYCNVTMPFTRSSQVINVVRNPFMAVTDLGCTGNWSSSFGQAWGCAGLRCSWMLGSGCC